VDRTNRAVAKSQVAATAHNGKLDKLQASGKEMLASLQREATGLRRRLETEDDPIIEMRYHEVCQQRAILQSALGTSETLRIPL